MNGYSKMRVLNPSKSKSMDLPNLNCSPHQAQESQDPPSMLGVEEDGERFGVILSRTCSSASQRFRRDSTDEKMRSSALQAVVKRAFSMRKSSSVGDGYWRIHDTGDEDRDDGDQGIHEEEEEEEMRPTARIKKRGKFFRACKRLFKF